MTNIMKHQPKRYRKFLLPAILAVLVVGLVTAGLVSHYHNSPKKPAATTSVRPQNSVKYSPATASDNAANESRKSSGSTATTLNNSGTPATTPSTTPSFNVTITKANTDSTAKMVYVGTLVSGVTSGDCTLTATQSGQQNASWTSTVKQDVNYYDCGVYSLPFTAFPHSGDWKLTLTVKNGTNQATNTWASPVTIPSS